MQNNLKVRFTLNILALFALMINSDIFSAEVKRDPFIPLIDPTGRVKAESELARPSEVFLPLNISLKGIIWSKTSSLAVINDKIYHEGDKLFEGLILEKIKPESIILNDRGDKVEINLRKKEKK